MSYMKFTIVIAAILIAAISVSADNDSEYVHGDTLNLTVSDTAVRPQVIFNDECVMGYWLKIRLGQAYGGRNLTISEMVNVAGPWLQPMVDTVNNDDWLGFETSGKADFEQWDSTAAFVKEITEIYGPEAATTVFNASIAVYRDIIAYHILKVAGVVDTVGDIYSRPDEVPGVGWGERFIAIKIYRKKNPNGPKIANLERENVELRNEVGELRTIVMRIVTEKTDTVVYDSTTIIREGFLSTVSASVSLYTTSYSNPMLKASLAIGSSTVSLEASVAISTSHEDVVRDSLQSAFGIMIQGAFNYHLKQDTAWTVYAGGQLYELRTTQSMTVGERIQSVVIGTTYRHGVLFASASWNPNYYKIKGYNGRSVDRGWSFKDYALGVGVAHTF